MEEAQARLQQTTDGTVNKGKKVESNIKTGSKNSTYAHNHTCAQYYNSNFQTKEKYQKRHSQNNFFKKKFRS